MRIRSGQRDHILDIGPGAGPRGGQLIAQGSLTDILQSEQSLTAQYLKGAIRIPFPACERLHDRRGRWKARWVMGGFAFMGLPKTT
jgi:excinuclease UvrABC ATPase subunit